MDPVFDDVAYLLDGLQRLNVLDTAGFHALCNSFVQSPPHSPWSTLLAFIAFALMGVHDWAPYILNGFLVFFLLLLAWDLVGLKNDWARAAIPLVVLLLQLPFQAVLEFRPDFAVALFTAAFALLLIKMACYGDDGSTQLRNHFCVGLLAGLAYLAKPTFFPHTTVMLFAAIALAEISRWQVGRYGLNLNSENAAATERRPPEILRFEPNPTTLEPRRLLHLWRAVLRHRRGDPEGSPSSIPNLVARVLATLAGAGLVAGPYFILSWRRILEYVLTNTGTGKDAAIWRVPGGFGAALSSRLWGYPTYLMLGPFAGVFAIWLVLGFCFVSARRNRPAMFFILSGAALAAISVLVISAGAMVDPHFSFSWEILFVLTTLFAVAAITKTERASFLGIAFCAMALFTFYKAPPTLNIWTVFEDTARGRSLNEAIVRQIATHAAGNFRGRSPVIYSTFMGKVNAASQSWLASKGNLNLIFRDLHRSGDIEEHMAAIQAANFVEIADPASQWLDRWLPSAPLQSALLEKLRALQGFRELSPVPGKEGTVFLFEKVR
ncbi:MAG: hypothetical protein WB586_13365 [Chthoniobacterales bacterium]